MVSNATDILIRRQKEFHNEIPFLSKRVKLMQILFYPTVQGTGINGV